jgi:hypothetical protein
MRGFPISFVTLARVALVSSFLALLIHPAWHRDTSDAVSFRTVANYTAACR